MSDDLAKRLRLWGEHGLTNTLSDLVEAADRIEALTAENERLRQFAQNAERCAAHGLAGDWSIALHDIKREARAALGDKQ